MPKSLTKIHNIISKGLEKTNHLWQSITIGYSWVEQVAVILENQDEKDSQSVQLEFDYLINSIKKDQGKALKLEESINHFIKVSNSYQDGLFHCYSIAEFPRTNNDLEQTFGSFRHHQRRCTGQKKSPRSTVIRGSSRLIAAIATKLTTFSNSDLAQVNVERWHNFRKHLQQINHSRIQQRHFRQDPDAYLQSLENEFLQLILPS